MVMCSKYSAGLLHKALALYTGLLYRTAKTRYGQSHVFLIVDHLWAFNRSNNREVYPAGLSLRPFYTYQILYFCLRGIQPQFLHGLVEILRREKEGIDMNCSAFGLREHTHVIGIERPIKNFSLSAKGRRAGRASET